VTTPRAFAPAPACVAAGLLALLPLSGPAGCGARQHEPPPAPPPIDPAPAAAPEFLDYAAVAAAHNANVARIDQLFAQTAVQVKFTDRDGDRRSEQGEGSLMLVRPDKLALRVGKVGETYFWLGCDQSRYWFFDLSKSPRTASVGVHGGPGQTGDAGLTAALPPRQFQRLLGIIPLPTSGPLVGNARTTPDGLIAVTTRLEVDPGTPGEPVQVLSLEPREKLVRRVEIFDNETGVTLVRADLTGDPLYIALTGTGETGPRIAPRIAITDELSGLEVVVFIADPQDGKPSPSRPRGRIVPASFDFQELLTALRADRVVDLDRDATTTTTTDEGGRR
jgi:hypothetical protein